MSLVRTYAFVAVIETVTQNPWMFRIGASDEELQRENLLHQGLKHGRTHQGGMCLDVTLTRRCCHEEILDLEQAAQRTKNACALFHWSDYRLVAAGAGAQHDGREVFARGSLDARRARVGVMSAIESPHR